MKAIYSDKYIVHFGQHPFVTERYRMLKEELEGKLCILEPTPPPLKDLHLVHSPFYIKKVFEARLSSQDLRRLELPFSSSLVHAQYLCVGGTLLTARTALTEGVCLHIGGGLHHAKRDSPAGFCLFNDVAVTAAKMLKEGVQGILIVDCDSHQGDGTAALLKGRRGIFTFSIHREDIFPFPKKESDLDVSLPPYIKKQDYLDALEGALFSIEEIFSPSLCIYVAGADPYFDDLLAPLPLDKKTLEERDRMVLRIMRERFCIPVAILLGGGYARSVKDTVQINYNTAKVAMEFADA